MYSSQFLVSIKNASVDSIVVQKEHIYSQFESISPRQEKIKRFFDLIITPVCLVLLLPTILVVALLVKITSPGPVMFLQPRIGLHNRVFLCWKFRTMYQQKADLLAAQQTMPGDARITPIGRWLRNLSLDELPQLVNVLKGEMSLVGPRPHAPHTKAAGEFFADVVENYHARHGVRPGITGLAQISGFRGLTDTREKLIGRVELDLAYIRGWSLWLDIRILLLTVVKGIYSRQAF
jgi:lipopolysaccharide/colanic/teichoic acid biosynthesis glycosyltransferase